MEGGVGYKGSSRTVVHLVLARSRWSLWSEGIWHSLFLERKGSKRKVKIRKEIRMRSLGGEIIWNVCKRLIKTDFIFFSLLCLCKNKKERQTRKALKIKLGIV